MTGPTSDVLAEIRARNADTTVLLRLLDEVTADRDRIAASSQEARELAREASWGAYRDARRGGDDALAAFLAHPRVDCIPNPEPHGELWLPRPGCEHVFCDARAWNVAHLCSRCTGAHQDADGGVG